MASFAARTDPRESLRHYIAAMRRNLHSLALTLALSMGVALAPPARAVDPTQPLDELHLQSWTRQDGAPGGINDLVQAPDGFLWIASTIGLYRFDGVHFERYSPAPGQPPITEEITSLAVAKSGELWGGLRSGGVIQVAPGRLVRWGKAQGLNTSTVQRVNIDETGAVWVAMFTGGLWRMEAGRWQRLQAESGFDNPGTAFWDVVFDPAGTTWVSSTEGIFFLRPGEQRFQRSPASEPGAGPALIRLTVDRQGDVWRNDVRNGLIRVTGQPRRITGHELGNEGYDGIGSKILFDRDGGMWAGRGALELVRVPRVHAAGPIQHQSMPQSRPMSGPRVRAFLEDREGNLWVGTTGGLDRLRATRVRPAVPERLNIEGPGLAVGDGGSLWFAQATGMRVLRDGELQPVVVERSIGHLHRDADGVLWIGGDNRLGRWAGGRYEELPVPPEVLNRGHPASVSGVVKAADGSLWVGFRLLRRNVYRFHEGQWSEAPWAAELEAVLVMAADSQGRLWLGLPGSRVAMFDGSQLHRFDASAGLATNITLAMVEIDGRMWAAGTGGVAMHRDGRFHPLLQADGTPFLAVSGLLRGPQGDLWINGDEGIYRVSAASLKAFAADPTRRAEVELLDHRHGVRGESARSSVSPSVLATADGRLWFSRSTNVYVVDTANLTRNPTPPPVSVTALRLDGVAQPPDAPLPAGTRQVEINYTALGLAMPEQLRFRYRLDGVDEQWQEAGGRRQAFYTNLPPGRHVFRVTAANEDGVWGEQGAQLAFHIPPAFHQTTWFAAICVAAAAALLWLAHRLRHRQLAARLRGQLEARAQERERIARDLHDTLLQSTQGMVLSLQAVATGLPGAARERVERALELTQRVMAEGRARVQGLRLAHAASHDLATELSACAAQLALLHPQPPALQLQVLGEPRALKPEAQDAALQIAQEALRNAHAHAGAQTLKVTLDYGAAGLRVTVEDDGHGFDVERSMEAGRRGGHWGLTGMHERAREAGGVLEVASGDRGTLVAMTIPPAVAYVPALRADR